MPHNGGLDSWSKNSRPTVSTLWSQEMQDTWVMDTSFMLQGQKVGANVTPALSGSGVEARPTVGVAH